MSLLLTALKGLVCLTPVVAVPVAIVLQKDSYNRTSYQTMGIHSLKEEENGPRCRLIVSNKDENVSVVVCPRDKERSDNQTSFYLYKKGDSSPFSEIDSWNFFNDDSFRLEITKTTDKTKETLNISHDQNWSTLNNKTLKDICTIEWKNNDFGPHKKMQCKDVTQTWLLQSWNETLPDQLKN